MIFNTKNEEMAICSTNYALGDGHLFLYVNSRQPSFLSCDRPVGIDTDQQAQNDVLGEK